MSRPYIPDALRKKVTETAGHRCGYCRTSQLITAMPMHVEHIIPLAAGGPSDEENLWLACPLCNGSKGVRTRASDPETGEEVSLFDPRNKFGAGIFSGVRVVQKSEVWHLADGRQLLPSNSTTRTSLAPAGVGYWLAGIRLQVRNRSEQGGI